MNVAAYSHQEVEEDLVLREGSKEFLKEHEDLEKNGDLDKVIEKISLLSKRLESVSSANSQKGSESQSLAIYNRPAPAEVIDDFIRNFFVRNNMWRALKAFESEWYQIKEMKGVRTEEEAKLEEIESVPDQYFCNNRLERELEEVKGELEEARTRAIRASVAWDAIRKERDFHKMHHRRVAQERNQLTTTIRRLHDCCSKYEPMMEDLNKKYEQALREKSLITIDREKLINKVNELKQKLNNLGGSSDVFDSQLNKEAKKEKAVLHSKKRLTERQWADMLPHNRKNPYFGVTLEETNISSFTLQKTVKGHYLPVSDLCLHPKQPIVATVSDDCCWKLWHLPEGQLIMSGKGHTDWISTIHFHPSGDMLATGSGDTATKPWSFETQCCISSLRDNSAIWCVRFHDFGQVLATCGMDQTTRLWDLGYTDSVNSLSWQPFTSNVCSASSDKTVSVRDARISLCVATLHRHKNSCNHCEFSADGTVIISCDSDGISKLWDIRNLKERISIKAGNYPSNKCTFDISAKVLSVASDDGILWNFSTLSGDRLIQLAGHDGAVQSVAYDRDRHYLVSCGSDCTFRYWA